MSKAFSTRFDARCHSGFKPKGDIFVFVDECHRTQSGDLHDAMKAILPNAMFIGFTGTPLLKTDKQTKPGDVRPLHSHLQVRRSRQRPRCVDLRYEARNIDQTLSSPDKVDQWFEAKTKGLTDLAKAQLKRRWGTMQKVLSRSRLEKIVADVLMDMNTRDRLKSGHGNAMLVSGSIYQACKFYELFEKTDLAGKCAIVTSYKPARGRYQGRRSRGGADREPSVVRDLPEDAGRLVQQTPEKAINRVEEFETAVKKKFVEEPGQMKLLIVVDKLLTGFDAPSATYLYIDKQMHDHGLFQAICRVNRLDGEDKEYGYIVDYKDLFKSLEGAVKDYTSGAFDGYEKEDVAGLLKDRLEKARKRLGGGAGSGQALCEPVKRHRTRAAYPAVLLREEFRQRRATEGERAEAPPAI